LDETLDKDPGDFDDGVLQSMLGMAGIEGTALPGRMAEINEVLNALPVPLRERVLVTYLNELFRRPEVPMSPESDLTRPADRVTTMSLPWPATQRPERPKPAGFWRPRGGSR